MYVHIFTVVEQRILNGHENQNNDDITDEGTHINTYMTWPGKFSTKAHGMQSNQSSQPWYYALKEWLIMKFCLV